ncbi:MAG: carbohydrate kinase family protein [Oscillospiraceae bacterium]|nr:carbohydrate kinase family protein [Oscillospiraceae bacterium]
MSRSKEKRHIACVGAAIVDCIIKGFDPEPISATGYFAEAAELAPGGEAVNQAVTFSKLGKKAAIVCFAGRDEAAAILTEELRRNGVETGFLLQPEGAKTPVTVMFVDESGDRRSITNRAHHYNFHPERDMSWMDGAAAVSLGSLFRAPFNDPEIVRAVTTEAKRRRLPVYADTKLPNANRLTLEDLRDSLPLIDCIFPNEKEGIFYTGETEEEAMADVFLRYGVRSVVIKLGERGCLFKNADKTIRLPGLTVRALDATGAGDNFAAGFITMRSEGKSYEESLRFANACGALSTTAVGATAGVKNRKEVLQLLRESPEAS